MCVCNIYRGRSFTVLFLLFSAYYMLNMGVSDLHSMSIYVYRAVHVYQSHILLPSPSYYPMLCTPSCQSVYGYSY
ncbi:hypothetical protein BDB01DRAFT_789937 [Pilobolus umbonatus]|nr:hypothetical protein BDB01DRAFT_789937 [Pilobolus umbonatus]